MAFIKTEEEIAKMREGGKILRETLRQLAEETKPGISCAEINESAGKILKEKEAEPSFLDYQGFPANLCISLNEEVVHGIPAKKIAQEGDMVSLDLGVKYKGLYTDATITFGCGEISELKQQMIKVCKKCLNLGVKQAKVGNRVGDIGAAVQEWAEKHGYSVVRVLVGHGVGHQVHEEPQIPNYGKKGRGMVLKENMCIAIEPMICEGGPEVVLADDGWAFLPKDGKMSCHYEHTLVVRKNGGEILT
ncbi:MAG: type I methionyl aminopeptidase [Patescibacteria group bacterium]|nr:type I methionyl aminopeptidase [Patescibacteria group bacterium]